MLHELMQCKRPIVHAGVHQPDSSLVRSWPQGTGHDHPAFRWYMIIWVHDTGQSQEAILQFIHVRWSNARSKTKTKILWQATTFRSCCFVPHIFQSRIDVIICRCQRGWIRQKGKETAASCNAAGASSFHSTQRVPAVQVDDLIWGLTSYCN